MKTLFPFQELGRDFLALRKNALQADDMGLGKTFMAIEAAKKLAVTNGIVLCPLTVRRTWYKNLREQYPSAYIKEITSSNHRVDHTAINVINYDIFWREPLFTYINDLRWQLLICDESHFLKDINAKRTKFVLGKKGIHKISDIHWLMTGTPILTRPIELYPTLRCLCPANLGEYADYYKYAYHFCDAYQDVYGFNASGASNLKELSAILRPVMIRRMKEDVLDQLPDITYEKVYLDPTDKLITLTKRENATADPDGSIRKAVGVLKIAPAIDYLTDILETKTKVVVYTWHKDVYHGLHDHFKGQSVLYTGEENADQKESNKRLFLKDERIRLFIGQINACGIGTDELQHVCDTAVFVELISVPGQIRQCIDRLRRIGQVNKVSAKFLVVEGSEDERIVDALCERSKNIRTILNERGETTNFIKFRCRLCGQDTEMSALIPTAGHSTCEKCSHKLKCLE